MYYSTDEFTYKRSIYSIILFIILTLPIAYLLSLYVIENFPVGYFSIISAIIFDSIFIYYILLLRKNLFSDNQIRLFDNKIQIPDSGIKTSPLVIPYHEIQLAEDLYTGIGLRRKLKIKLRNNKTLLLDSNYFEFKEDYMDFLYYLNTHINVKTRDTLTQPELDFFVNNILDKKHNIENFKKELKNSSLSEKDQNAFLKDASKIFSIYDRTTEHNEFINNINQLRDGQRRKLKIIKNLITFFFWIFGLTVFVLKVKYS